MLIAMISHRGFSVLYPRLNVSPFMQFNPATYRLPERVRPIFDDFSDLDELKRAISGMKFRRSVAPKSWTDRIEPMLGYGGFYIAMHEVAHVALRHFQQVRLIKSAHLLQQFSLSVNEAEKCIELDADIFAARKTIQSAVKYGQIWIPGKLVS